MGEWVYLIHPPRDDFAATMTDAESEAWGRHWERLKVLFDEGRIILIGPTLGSVNTGICVFEAADEQDALDLMNGDPVIAEGFARGELRAMRVSLLRGRDEERVRSGLQTPGDRRETPDREPRILGG